MLIFYHRPDIVCWWMGLGSRGRNAVSFFRGNFRWKSDLAWESHASLTEALRMPFVIDVANGNSAYILLLSPLMLLNDLNKNCVSQALLQLGFWKTLDSCDVVSIWIGYLCAACELPGFSGTVVVALILGIDYIILSLNSVLWQFPVLHILDKGRYWGFSGRQVCQYGCITPPTSWPFQPFLQALNSRCSIHFCFRCLVLNTGTLINIPVNLVRVTKS